jgi:hypothetical protein
MTDKKINRTEDPEINPDSYSHLIFYKKPKIYLGEKTASLTVGDGEIRYSHIED